MWIARRLKTENNEATANKYVIHCMSITMLIISGIWILNILNIFLVSKKVMAYSVGLSLVTFAIGMIVWLIFGLNKKWVKYVIIFWSVMITTIMGTGLTYHAIIASVLPILFCSLYSSKKLMAYTSILTIISTFIIVFAGYHLGICDANMTLLTGEPLSVYLDVDGNFTRTDVNNQLAWSLTLFFVVPRCLIYTMCMLVCYNIGKIIRNNAERAKQMETLAEIDGMTGLYNRSKYLGILSNTFEEQDNVAVIFWDINNLKIINDSKGHETGDLLIRTVADSIRMLVKGKNKAFRIGGDEFVMIMNNSDENDAIKMIEVWRKNIAEIQTNHPFDVSASVGYASGKGKDLKEIINAADKMMYEEKKIYHMQQKGK